MQPLAPAFCLPAATEEYIKAHRVWSELHSRAKALPER